MKHISTRLISNTRGAALPDTTFLRFCQGGRHQWAPVLRVRIPSDWTELLVIFDEWVFTPSHPQSEAGPQPKMSGAWKVVSFVEVG